MFGLVVDGIVVAIIVGSVGVVLLEVAPVTFGGKALGMESVEFVVVADVEGVVGVFDVG